MAEEFIISLPAELVGTMRELAREQGISTEALIAEVLRDRFAEHRKPIDPGDEWERAIVQLGANCGVSLTDEALSSEGLYESWPI